MPIRQHWTKRLIVLSACWPIADACTTARSIVFFAVQGKAILPKPGNGAHDAVRRKNANAAVRAEGRRDCAERLQLEKSIGLVKRAVEEADAPGALRGFQRLHGHCRDRTRVEIPEPLREVALRRAAPLWRDLVRCTMTALCIF